MSSKHLEETLICMANSRDSCYGSKGRCRDNFRGDLGIKKIANRTAEYSEKFANPSAASARGYMTMSSCLKIRVVE